MVTILSVVQSLTSALHDQFEHTSYSKVSIPFHTFIMQELQKLKNPDSNPDLVSWPIL